MTVSEFHSPFASRIRTVCSPARASSMAYGIRASVHRIQGARILGGRILAAHEVGPLGLGFQVLDRTEDHIALVTAMPSRTVYSSSRPRKTAVPPG